MDLLASVNLGKHVLYSPLLLARKHAGVHQLQCHLVEQASCHFYWTTTQMAHRIIDQEKRKRKCVIYLCMAGYGGWSPGDYPATRIIMVSVLCHEC